MSEHEAAHDIVEAAMVDGCACPECVEYRTHRSHDAALWRLGNRIDHLQQEVATLRASYAILSDATYDRIAGHAAAEVLLALRRAISLWVDMYSPDYGDQ